MDVNGYDLLAYVTLCPFLSCPLPSICLIWLVGMRKAIVTRQSIPTKRSEEDLESSNMCSISMTQQDGQCEKHLPRGMKVRSSNGVQTNWTLSDSKRLLSFPFKFVLKNLVHSVWL